MMMMSVAGTTSPLYPRKCTHPHLNDKSYETKIKLLKFQKQHFLNVKNANQYVKITESVFINNGQG